MRCCGHCFVEGHDRRKCPLKDVPHEEAACRTAGQREKDRLARAAAYVEERRQAAAAAAFAAADKEQRQVQDIVRDVGKLLAGAPMRRRDDIYQMIWSWVKGQDFGYASAFEEEPELPDLPPPLLAAVEKLRCDLANVEAAVDQRTAVERERHKTSDRADFWPKRARA